MAEGSWWIFSKSDPRWNKSGRGRVGMFSHHQAQEEIERLKPLLGEPPTDLEIGYMKD